MTVYQNETDRCYRTLWQYGEDARVVYDEDRNLRMVHFRCTSTQVDLWPVCSDCGEVIREGYTSTDGDNAVVYCFECIRQIIEAEA